MIKEKVIIDDNFSNKIDNELKLFLANIFSQDIKKSYRTNT